MLGGNFYSFVRIILLYYVTFQWPVIALSYTTCYFTLDNQNVLSYCIRLAHLQFTTTFVNIGVKQYTWV